jgi:hypothetical protein
MWAPIRRATTERVIALCSLVAAVSIPLGYLVVARLRIDTLAPSGTTDRAPRSPAWEGWP